MYLDDSLEHNLILGEQKESLHPDQYNPLSDLCLMKAKLFLNTSMSEHGVILECLHRLFIALEFLSFEQITRILQILIFFFSPTRFSPPSSPITLMLSY